MNRLCVPATLLMELLGAPSLFLLGKLNITHPNHYLASVIRRLAMSRLTERAPFPDNGSFCGWTKSCTTMRHICNGIIIQGLLRWCRISSIHSLRCSLPNCIHCSTLCTPRTTQANAVFAAVLVNVAPWVLNAFYNGDVLYQTSQIELYLDGSGLNLMVHPGYPTTHGTGC